MAALQKQRIRIHLSLADYHKIKNIKVIQTLFLSSAHMPYYIVLRGKILREHFMPKNGL